MLQMIGGQSREFRSERRSAEVRQLIRVQFDRQSERLRRTKHPRGLIARESDAFHEGVDGVRKAGLRHRRQHLAANQIDVSILVAIGFGRQRMRAKKRRPDADRPAAAQRACG